MPAPHVAHGVGVDTTRRVELYGRVSGSVARTVAGYRDRLDALSSAGVLDDVELTPWPDRLELTDEDHGAIEAYERFTEWADAAGTELAPAFTVQTYDSEYLGRMGTALLTPVACVAVHEDGELTGVYPHADDGEVHTVDDAVTALEGLAPAAAMPGTPGRGRVLVEEREE